MLKGIRNNNNIKEYKFLQINEYILLINIKMILFIDTVSPAPKILLIDNNIISFVEIPINNNTQISESIIMKLLETFNANFNVKAIKKIVVCRGPGSFTALRIGIGVAIGLRSALNIPLYGVTAFDILFKYSRVNYRYENVHIIVGSSNNQKFYAALNIKGGFIIKPQKCSWVNYNTFISNNILILTLNRQMIPILILIISSFINMRSHNLTHR